MEELPSIGSVIKEALMHFTVEESDLPTSIKRKSALEETDNTFSNTNAIVEEDFGLSGSELTSSLVHMVIKTDVILREPDNEGLTREVFHTIILLNY